MLSPTAAGHIARIQRTLEPARQRIISHPIYAAITGLGGVRTFMQHHVYAVWDFMSLLKSLQRSLTCTSVPWFPVGSADTRYLINEIVVGEESDVDAVGIRTSHFEMYTAAMRQCGADTAAIETFCERLQQWTDLPAAFDAAGIPQSIRDFVGYTFEVIDSGKTHAQAAVFTFGREDLIPGMFVSMIGELHKNFPDDIAAFKYYIERHIEVDGDHHSHLALQMTASLCGDDEALWQEAEDAALKALEHRIGLWDGVYRELIADANLRREESTALLAQSAF